MYGVAPSFSWSSLKTKLKKPKMKILPTSKGVERHQLHNLISFPDYGIFVRQPHGFLLSWTKGQEQARALKDLDQWIWILTTRSIRLARNRAVPTENTVIGPRRCLSGDTWILQGALCRLIFQSGHFETCNLFFKTTFPYNRPLDFSWCGVPLMTCTPVSEVMTQHQCKITFIFRVHFCKLQT